MPPTPPAGGLIAPGSSHIIRDKRLYVSPLREITPKGVTAASKLGWAVCRRLMSPRDGDSV